MKTMDKELLDETVKRIVTALHPKAIYLYGSHAYGQPHQDSDVDLFVVVSESDLPPHRRAVAAYRALRGLFLPAEVKVVTEAELERRAQWSSSVDEARRAVAGAEAIWEFVLGLLPPDLRLELPVEEW